MDTSGLITIATGAFTAVGGFFGGRRMATSDANSATQTAMTVASTTVDMLQSQVDGLQGREELRTVSFDLLASKVVILEGLVTQRADVETVKTIIRIIAEKVGADVSHVVDPTHAGPDH